MNTAFQTPISTSCKRSTTSMSNMLKPNCHIPYLTSNTSSPTPTFRTYLRPFLRRYFYLTSPDPFVAMQLSLLFLSISTCPYCPLSPIVPYCLHTLLLPTCILTCILTCNIRALLSLLFIP